MYGSGLISGCRGANQGRALTGSGIAISAEVWSLLQRSTIDGKVLKLPGDQTARPLYGGVNEVLVALGEKMRRMTLRTPAISTKCMTQFLAVFRRFDAIIHENR